jgi:hypothetical protein
MLMYTTYLHHNGSLDVHGVPAMSGQHQEAGGYETEHPASPPFSSLVSPTDRFMVPARPQPSKRPIQGQAFRQILSKQLHKQPTVTRKMANAMCRRSHFFP